MFGEEYADALEWDRELFCLECGNVCRGGGNNELRDEDRTVVDQ